MVDIIFFISIWIHVLSAIIWLGSAMTVEFILIPSIVNNLNPQTISSVSLMGKRLAITGQITSVLLLITGAYQAFADNVLSFQGLFNTIFGNVVLIKVILFIIFAGLSETIAAKLKKIYPIVLARLRICNM